MEEKEFLRLINENKAIMHECCAVYCGGLSREDLIQEIILETWRTISKFEWKCKFSTWLYNVSRNICISNLRKHKKVERLEELDNYEELIIDNSAEEIETQLEEARKYEAVMDSLEEPLKSLFWLYLEGMCVEDIAEFMQVDANWLRVNIHRIKKRLYLRYKQTIPVQ